MNPFTSNISGECAKGSGVSSPVPWGPWSVSLRPSQPSPSFGCAWTSALRPNGRAAPPSAPPCRALGAQCRSLPVTLRIGPLEEGNASLDHEATWLMGHTQHITFFDDLWEDEGSCTSTRSSTSRADICIARVHPPAARPTDSWDLLLRDRTVPTSRAGCLGTGFRSWTTGGGPFAS